MSLRSLLDNLTRPFISIALVLTTYLYLYPAWFGCAFPSTDGSALGGYRNVVAQHVGRVPNEQNIAPFRLLVLADPQLEGDSSLPDPEDALLRKLKRHGQGLLGIGATVSNATIGNATLSNDTVSNDTAGSDIADNDTADNDTAGNHTAGNHTAGNDTASNDTVSNDTASNDTASYDTVRNNSLWNVLQQVLFEDIPVALWGVRKRIDLFGNDYYLAHIYRTLYWWTNPTHVTVLGDLIGSQWVSDGEFDWRGWRYWNRVFTGGQRVEDEIMDIHKSDKAKDVLFPLEQDENWKRRIINIAGNHDIGYAGDITKVRMERFERVFGKANWDIRFVYPNISNSTAPTLHIIVLNDMLFDTPALDESLQGDTYDYVNSLITSRLSPVEDRNTTFTLLLTHVPLYKPEGVCVDPPFFDFWDDSDGGGVYLPHGLKEQNHLSEHSSRNGILSSIFGMSSDPKSPAGGKGRNGLILTGHDHEGCDTWHFLPAVATTQASEHERDEEAGEEKPQPQWECVHTSQFNSSTAASMHTGLREVTLRSMMGSYSGNAGLLSLWYDFERQTWDYAIQMCPLGVQHTWWAIHVIDFVAVMLVVRQGILKARSMLGYPKKASGITRSEKNPGIRPGVRKAVKND